MSLTLLAVEELWLMEKDDWENTSASGPKLAACRLLLLTGAPKCSSPRSLLPSFLSLLFNGLDRMGSASAMTTIVSCFGRANSNLIGPSFTSNRNNGGLFSDLGIGESLLLSEFSSPELRREAEGVVFPEFELSLRTRRIGLRVDAIILGDDRNGTAVRRRLNFFFGADNCSASGEPAVELP
jgi:hypothetical protein